MFKKITRWLRSKAGKQTLAGVLAVLVIAALVGQLAGAWDFRKLFGTTVMGGYHCMPSCNYMTPDMPGYDPELQQDGKFFSLPGERMDSFTGAKVVVWIEVDPNQSTVEVGIFDGDSGKNNAGVVDIWNGNWDGTSDETTYTLYTDRLKDGPTADDVLVGQWSSNDMPNNAWFTIPPFAVSAAAQAPSGYYFYRFEAVRTAVAGGPGTLTGGIQAFKVRATGSLSSGYADIIDSGFAIVGMLATMNDARILYPEFDTYYPTYKQTGLGPSTYTGEWDFYFDVPTNTVRIELWNGDFDRGPDNAPSNPPDDSDDPNTPNVVPAFLASAGNAIRPEGAWGAGSPADDTSNLVRIRKPAVTYEIIDPAGSPIYTDPEPSGSQEWERFVLSTPADPQAAQADLIAQTILPGKYNFHIKGLDVHNTVWIRFPQCVSLDGDGCKPVYKETACPRTIGYWKNNFNKIFGDGKGNAQETQASLTEALQTLGQISPLYRHGINVQNPQPLPASAGPLTPGEALMILMRKDVKLKDGTPIAYPGGKDQYNSMLARALQQDLASWLNFTSGKIGRFMYIELTMPSGPYQGSLWDALHQAQQIVFTYGSNRGAPQLERAKDIGDQINNGNLGEDAPEGSCQTNPAAYEQKIPPAKQPPTHDKLPKAPKPPKPPHPTPVPPKDPEVPGACQARTNYYNVENPTNNPFYGIKFEYQSGTEVKNGAYEEFKFTLPTDVVAQMTSIQVEAKSATQVAIMTLECKFDLPMGCGDPAMDPNDWYAVSFKGATDNGDGTTTLTFHLQNLTQYGLSHATFGLPAGVVPSAPRSSFKSSICLDEPTVDKPVPPPNSGNLCANIFSPGYWKNWNNHYTADQFQALIAATAHYNTLTVEQATAQLNDNSDQYHRHLLSAELNVAASAALGAGVYNYGGLSGQTVSQILDTAFNTPNPGADLLDAILYLGSNGEGDAQCRAQ